MHFFRWPAILNVGKNKPLGDLMGKGRKTHVGISNHYI
jgi:hypothetical protein